MKERKTLQPKFTGERKAHTDSHEQILSLLAMIEAQNPEARKPAETLPDGWVLKQKQRFVQHTVSEDEKKKTSGNTIQKDRFNLLGSIALVLVYERTKLKGGAGGGQESAAQDADKTSAHKDTPSHDTPHQNQVAEQSAEEDADINELMELAEYETTETAELVEALDNLMPEEVLMPHLEHQMIASEKALPVPTIGDYANSYVTAIAHNPQHDALIQEAQQFIAQFNSVALPQATGEHLQLTRQLIQHPQVLHDLALNTSTDAMMAPQIAAPEMLAIDAPSQDMSLDGAIPFIGGNVLLNSFSRNTEELMALPVQPVQQEHAMAMEHAAPQFDYRQNPFYQGSLPKAPMPNFNDPAFGGSGSTSSGNESVV